MVVSRKGENPATGLRVGIVGGSIAGCAAAVALSRVGCAVTVFERSLGVLADRGAGIGIAPEVQATLTAKGLIDPAMPYCTRSQTRFVSRGETDNRHAPDGEVLWELPGLGHQTRWGTLYRHLRAQIPAVNYRQGCRVTVLREMSDGLIDVHVTDGGAVPFELVVCADGPNSEVRQRMFPEHPPVYAGYVAWRGLLSTRAVPRTDMFADRLTFAIHDHGHCILYYVPGSDGTVGPADRLLNWAWYDPMPEAELFRLLHSSYGGERVTSLPPGTIPAAQRASLCARARAMFPPAVADVIAATDEPFMQPIVDVHVPRYIEGRLCLLGDASSVARPHTATGATKAMTQAVALAEALRDHTSVEAALRAWNNEVNPVGAALVERGRAMGTRMVMQTPGWRHMKPAVVQQWLAETFVPGHGGATPLAPGAPPATQAAKGPQQKV